MGAIVNLRIARKRAKRREAEQEAASRRLIHGRSKAEQNLERSQSDRASEASTNTGSKLETGNEIAGS